MAGYYYYYYYYHYHDYYYYCYFYYYLKWQAKEHMRMQVFLNIRHHRYAYQIVY